MSSQVNHRGLWWLPRPWHIHPLALSFMPIRTSLLINFSVSLFSFSSSASKNFFLSAARRPILHNSNDLWPSWPVNTSGWLLLLSEPVRQPSAVVLTFFALRSNKLCGQVRSCGYFPSFQLNLIHLNLQQRKAFNAPLIYWTFFFFALDIR